MRESNLPEKGSNRAEIVDEFRRILNASRTYDIGGKPKSSLTEDEQNLFNYGLDTQELKEIQRLISKTFEIFGSHETLKVLSGILIEYEDKITPKLREVILYSFEVTARSASKARNN